MSEQAENDPNDGLRERLQKQGEDALGQFAQQLLESPLVHRALAGAFDAREKAAQAQEAAMGALNLPSAADLERLTRRVRSLSQRLEGIEDGVDRLDERLAAMPAAQGSRSASAGSRRRCRSSATRSRRCARSCRRRRGRSR